MSTTTPDNPVAPDAPVQTQTVEELRDAQLAAGQTTGARKRAAEARTRMNAAEQRAGVRGAKPVDGRVDNMTRRDDNDVLQGHFCVIDFGDKSHGSDALKGVEALVGEGNAGAGRADYGVYLNPGELDGDGYPLTAVVLLRDEHAGQVIVPYGALRPANAGGRR